LLDEDFGVEGYWGLLPLKEIPATIEQIPRPLN
jgi:hypothetical protein